MKHLFCSGICVITFLFTVGKIDGLCPVLEPPENGILKISSSGATAAYICNNDITLTFCVDGNWTRLAPFCNGDSDNLSSIIQNKEKNHDSFWNNRIKRSPYNGKFQALRRNERVDAMVRNGKLETSIVSGTPTIVRVHPGDTAYLMCRVKNLGTKSIMWSGKGKVLTIDTTVLTDNHKLFPSYDQITGTWMLEVRPVRQSDAGDYECRVNGRTPLTHIVSLQVVSPGRPLLPTFQKDGRDDVIKVIQNNVTSLWKEVEELKAEIVQHLHDGHDELEHDDLMKEVEMMIHEQLVHYQQVPHDAHSQHHNPHVLDHYGAHHKHYNGHQHHHKLDDDDDDDDKDDDSIEVVDDDSNEDTDDQQNDRNDQHNHDHQQQNHQHHHHGHDQGHHHQHQGHHHQDHGHHHQNHGHHHQHHGHQGHHQHGHQNNNIDNLSWKDQHDLHGLHNHHHDQDDDSLWVVAHCDLQPNTDLPQSEAHGHIIISQRVDKKSDIFFDITLYSGLRQAKPATYGFHIHENSIASNNCSTAGPEVQSWYSTQVPNGSKNSDAAIIGDIEVPGSGQFTGYLKLSGPADNTGPNDLVNKTIVAYSSSLKNTGLTAAVGVKKQVACCTVKSNVFKQPDPNVNTNVHSIRFNG